MDVYVGASGFARSDHTIASHALTAARSSLIKCLHCDDMRADWRQSES